jgi:hypothetical protein
MSNQAATINPARVEGVGFEDLAKALDRAINEGLALPAWALGLHRTPPTLDVHTCAICQTQALTEPGIIPAAWSAPHGLMGPVFCPDCDPGPVPGAIDPSRIVPEVRGTWESARA